MLTTEFKCLGENNSYYLVYDRIPHSLSVYDECQGLLINIYVS